MTKNLKKVNARLAKISALLLSAVVPHHAQISQPQSLRQLASQIEISLIDLGLDSQQITERVIAALPDIRRLVYKDAQAILDSDPAATDIDLILACYPGILAITHYRFSHLLAREGVPYLPRFLTEYAHSLTGIDIHPHAEIGERSAIDHGTGIVIGETTKIGNNVKIYQGVTLGGLSVKKGLKGSKRHPTIEDDVTIYSNASILGGQTVVGKGSIIGGNVCLTKSVPPGTTVISANKIKLKTI